MSTEFRISKGWRIFAVIFFPLLMLLFAYLGIRPYLQDVFDLRFALQWTAVFVVVEIFSIFGLTYIFKSKLIVEEDQLVYTGVFISRKLQFSNIRGIKLEKNFLHFYPKNKNGKTIKVSTSVAGFRNLLQWAVTYFPDVKTVEYLDSEKELLNNETYGATKEERGVRLKKAKTISRIFNAASFIVGFATFFYPYFYDAQVLVCCVLPIAGIIIYKVYKGLIQLDELPNSPYPNIAYTIAVPSGVICFRALMDFDIFDYSNLWKPVAFVFVSFCISAVIVTATTYNFKKVVTYLTIFATLIIGGTYAYGVVATTNAVFDKSEPSVYSTKILDKRVSKTKYPRCYLKLDTWGPRNEVDEMVVSKETYLSHEIGDTVVVHFKHGFYNVPYYFIKQ